MEIEIVKDDGNGNFSGIIGLTSETNVAMLNKECVFVAQGERTAFFSGGQMKGDGTTVVKPFKWWDNKVGETLVVEANQNTGMITWTEKKTRKVLC